VVMSDDNHRLSGDLTVQLRNCPVDDVSCTFLETLDMFVIPCVDIVQISPVNGTAPG
jgi:hypothetical protein